MGLEVNGVILPLTDQGFLTDFKQWDERVALALASQEGIFLEAGHWEILHFIRDYYLCYKHLPNTRIFIKAIQASLGQEKGCSRYLHALFPQGPLKYACKLSGLPKPPTCL